MNGGEGGDDGVEIGLGQVLGCLLQLHAITLLIIGLEN